jgi:hypothetical protein
VPSRSLVWVEIEQAKNSGKKLQKREWSLSPGRRRGSEASRTPQPTEGRGHDAAGCPRNWGARGRKDLGLELPLPNFVRKLRRLRARSKAAASGPGARARAPASPERSRQAGPVRAARGARALGGRARSIARSPVRPLSTAPAARLSALPALSLRRPRRRRRRRRRRRLLRRVTPPLKPEPFPGRRRPLCQSAPCAPAAPQPRAAPTPRSSSETPTRVARGRSRSPRAGVPREPPNKAWSRAPRRRRLLLSWRARLAQGLQSDCVTLFYVNLGNT